MKKLFALNYLLQFLLAAILLITFTSNSLSQSDKTDRENESNNQTSLQGLTEAILIDYYKQEVIAKVLPKVFTGGPASIQTPRKLNLLKELRYVDSAIRPEKYKGSDYLAIDVGGDKFVYNSLRLDQMNRLGDSLNQRVLSYFKRIARIIKFQPDVDGNKISILVPHKNFVTEAYMQPSYDRVEIYAAMDVIQQFADDELTNQEFVEESILLVNGNRMTIPIIKSL